MKRRLTKKERGARNALKRIEKAIRSSRHVPQHLREFVETSTARAIRKLEWAA